MEPVLLKPEKDIAQSYAEDSQAEKRADKSDETIEDITDTSTDIGKKNWRSLFQMLHEIIGYTQHQQYASKITVDGLFIERILLFDGRAFTKAFKDG